MVKYWVRMIYPDDNGPRKFRYIYKRVDNKDDAERYAQYLREIWKDWAEVSILEDDREEHGNIEIVNG